MTEKDVVLSVMTEVGVNKSELSNMAGYSSKSAVTEILNRTGMKVDILLKLLNAMNCELIVRHDGKEWIIDTSNAPATFSPKQTKSTATRSSVDLDTLLSDEPTKTSTRKIKLK